MAAGPDGENAMWLRVSDATGRSTDLHVVGVGGAVRVAVGEVGRRSSIWRIWANKATSDVYVATRTTARNQKFSFHQSGYWRYAWTTNASGVAPENRVIDRWRRGDEDAAGWTKMLSIWVRAVDVASMPDDTRAEDVIWVPAPPPGRAAGIHLVLATPDKGEVALEGGAPLAVIRLASGQAVIVLATYIGVSPDGEGEAEAQRASAIASLPAADQEVVRAGAGMRAALFGFDNADGARWVWDMAATEAQ